MILELTEEQRRYREQVHAMLAQEWSNQDVARVRALGPEDEPGVLEIHRKLGDKGWLAANWPVEHGGSGLSIVEKAILTEELILHGVPDNVHTLSIDIVGLAIHLIGTQEQRKRLLPGLARGETSAVVLLSEPGVGSDLASLQTRAVPDGDGWRISGRKIFNMKSHHADFALCAARTSTHEAAHQGITLFLVPMKSVGVVIRPIWNLTDERFDDVALEGIWVGPQDVLGEVDNGWQALGQVLPLERTGLDYAAKASRTLRALLRHAADSGKLDDAGHARQLVELDARVRAAQLLAWRCIANLRDGKHDEVHLATAKWYASEVAKEVSGVAMQVAGLPATLRAGEPGAIHDGLFDMSIREAPGLTLAGGSSEIMLSFVAASGLDLPL